MCAEAIFFNSHTNLFQLDNLLIEKVISRSTLRKVVYAQFSACRNSNGALQNDVIVSFTVVQICCFQTNNVLKMSCI